MSTENLNLAAIVVDARKKMGLSQEALAEKAKVSLSTIQRIEKGTVTPRAYTLKILAESLDLDFSSLVETRKQEVPEIKNYASAKRVNLITLALVFIPLMNLAAPVLLWNKKKQTDEVNFIIGKIISFQLLWTVVTFIGMGITLFLSNLIIGQAGDGGHYILIFYLLSLLFNIFIIIKTTVQLNNKSNKVLSFIPNLF